MASSPFAILPLAYEPAWIVITLLWSGILVAVGADIATLRRAALTVSLVKPGSVGVGSRVKAKALVELRSNRPLRATMRAIAEPPLHADVAKSIVLSPGKTEVAIELTAHRRGMGALREIWLRLSGPLGLVTRIERADRGAGAVAIVPDVERAARATMEVFGAQPMLSGLKREKWSGDGGEFESLQAYSLGMNLGAVDWKATARHQQLRVRRFRLERRQRIVLSIDVGRAMRDPISGIERLDHAVHAALVLGRSALQSGDLVGLHAYAGEPRAWLPPRSGAGQFGRMRHGCASLRSETDETNHVLGLHDLLRRVNRRSMVVVFTEFSDATTAELMVEALGQLAHKHVIVFVALDDPAIEEPMSALPEKASDLASAVVAGNLAQRRHFVLARLRHLGVHVVQAPVGAVAANLVERYVQIKARGLLG
jgi:uncharacterized protein (DUF58 family)